MIVCLDANCVIYFVELHPVWGPRIIARIAALRAAGDEIAVIDLARTECLVGPLASGNAVVLASYQAFFADPAIRCLPLTPSVCERAARIRVASAMQFKLPDCLHLATAVENGCGLFLTNDTQLSLFSDIAVEVLS